jgi:hypothetical protein
MRSIRAGWLSVAVLTVAFLALLPVSSATAHPGNEWGANKAVAASKVRIRYPFVEKVYCRPPTPREISVYLPSTITFVDQGIRYWNHFVCGAVFKDGGKTVHDTAIYHQTGECAKCWQVTFSRNVRYAVGW